MCNNSQMQIRLLRCVLRCFEVVSGLKVNFSKTIMEGVSEIVNLDMLAADMGCRMGQLPNTYLGLHLGALYKKEKVKVLVVERIQRRLVECNLNTYQRVAM